MDVIGSMDRLNAALRRLVWAAVPWAFAVLAVLMVVAVVKPRVLTDGQFGIRMGAWGMESVGWNGAVWGRDVFVGPSRAWMPEVRVGVGGAFVMVYVPWWLALSVSGGATVWQWHLGVRRAVEERRFRRVCLRCGYDLRASAAQCPECGTMLPEPPEVVGPDGLPRRRRRQRVAG